MAATLRDVIERLEENREAQEDTTQEVFNLGSRVDQLLKGMKIQNLDMLEALRESAAAVKKAAPAAGAAGAKPTAAASVKFKDDGLFANLPKKLPFLAGLATIAGGLTIGTIGILRALGPAGVGIAAFFTGLAAASAIMNNFSKDGGVGLKNLLKNVGEGLGTFGTKQFAAFGAVLAAGIVFPRRAGMGMALAGGGIGAFLTALALSSGAAKFLSGDQGESIKNLLKNVAEGLGAFDLGTFGAFAALIAPGAIFGLVRGGVVIAGKAAIGMGLIGAGIGAFIGGLAAVTDFAALFGVTGKGFKEMMTNISAGLKATGDIKTEGLMTKVLAIGTIGPALVSAILGFTAAQGIDFLIDSAKKVINFLTFGMAGLKDQASARKTLIQSLVDALLPLRDIPDNLGAGLDKLGDSLVNFVTSFNTVGKNLDIDTFADTFQELGHALATTRKLIFAMANGGEFKIPGFLAQLGRLTNLGGTIDFGPAGGGGMLDPTLKLDELINKIGQINLVLGKTNVSAVASQGNTTSQQIGASKANGNTDRPIIIQDNSNKSGGNNINNQSVLFPSATAADTNDPLINRAIAMRLIPS